MDLKMSLKQAGEVYRNAKTKQYIDGSTNTVVCRNPIFKVNTIKSLEQLAKEDEKIRQAMENSQGIIDYLNAKQIDYDEYYDRRKKYLKEHPKSVNHHDNNNVRDDSLKRAKDEIFDYVLNNRFSYFFTGTINPEFFDSQNPKVLIKPVQDWLRNKVQRNNLSYIMIAERHKVSNGIHFHGCLSGENLNFEDSGTKLYKGYNKPVSNEKAQLLGLSDGRTVYNLVNWGFGFSTAIQLQGNPLNYAYYITKYITKDCKKIFGKFFWHSRNLKKPVVDIHDLNFDDLAVTESNGFKYLFQGKQEITPLDF